MQSHETKTGKDGAIYKKDAEELSSRGFCRDKKKSGLQNKEYVGALSLKNKNIRSMQTILKWSTLRAPRKSAP